MERDAPQMSHSQVLGIETRARPHVNPHQMQSLVSAMAGQHREMGRDQRELPHLARLLNTRDIGNFAPANVTNYIDPTLVGFPLFFEDTDQFVNWCCSVGLSAFITQLCNAVANATAKKYQAQLGHGMYNQSAVPLQFNGPIPTATLSTLATANTTGPLCAMQVTSGNLTDKSRRARGRPKGSVKRGHEMDDAEKADEPPEKRGRGRPKGSKNKKHKTVTLEPVDINSDPVLARTLYGQGQELPKRPRGRPKGSKSKVSILREVVDTGPLAMSTFIDPGVPQSGLEPPAPSLPLDTHHQRH